MNYEPGTVAVATVRGVPNVRVFLDETKHMCWTSAVAVKGSVCHYPDDVTEVRPLVVLDLDDYDMEKFASILKAILRGETNQTYAGPWARAAHIAVRQIEARTKPPRIPEPGLWGVAEAWKPGVATRRWVHHEEDRWVSDCGHIARWEDLNDPVLVRPGIEDET